MTAEDIINLKTDDPDVWKEAMTNVIMDMTEEECQELLALWKGTIQHDKAS